MFSSISTKGLFSFHFQLFFVVPGIFNLHESSRDNISWIGAIKRLAFVSMPIFIKLHEGSSENLYSSFIRFLELFSKDSHHEIEVELSCVPV